MIKLFSFLLTILAFGCGSPSREAEPTGPLEIRWVYSYEMADGALGREFADSSWAVFFEGPADSLKLSQSAAAVPWTRIHLSGTHQRGQLPAVGFPSDDPSLIQVTVFPGSIDVNPFLTRDSIRYRLLVDLDSLKQVHPETNLIVVYNPQTASIADQTDQRLIPIRSGVPETVIQDEENRRLVRTMKRMDSLLLGNKLDEFSKFMHGGYADNGVSKSDKMNFYKFIALRMEGMHFDYGNFLFETLPDGRKFLYYQYNLWKQDTLVDSGTEMRYFKQVNGVWKETGNLSRFYKNVLDAKNMGGEREFYVYLPPDYFTNVKRRYPVIYVFNDFLDRTQDWVAYRIDEKFDRAIEKGLMKPAIIIFMDGGPSLYMKSVHADAYNFEDFFMNGVGANFDLTLRTIPDRDYRYLTGFGQGGLAAMYYGIKYPTLFSSVASVNGRLTQSLLAGHVDGGDPDYWKDKYPAYYLNMMPDHIKSMLNFILLQQKNGDQMNDFLTVTSLMDTKGVRYQATVFEDVWQENFPLIIEKAFGGHMASRRK